MSGSSGRTPQKEGSQSPGIILSPSRIIKSPSAVGELVDQHKQLRHEAGGLRLQLAAKQEILDRVVDLLDTSMAELAQAKVTVQNQAATIRDLTQQLGQATGRTGHAVQSTVPAPKQQNKAGSKKEEATPQLQQPLPSTTPSAEAVLTSIESSSSKPAENKESISNRASIAGFEKLTIELNELEEVIRGSGETTSAAGGTTEQPIPTPVSARDRIAAFEKAAKEALILQQRDLVGNKLPELASQCKITAAARAGSSGGDGGGNKSRGKKKTNKSTPIG